MAKTRLASFVVACVLAAHAPCALAAETTIFTFVPESGTSPQSALLPDGTGGFYGTTSGGHGFGLGTIYHLLPPNRSSTAWTSVVLHSFTAADGERPGDLLFGKDGALYGSALNGGFTGNSLDVCYGIGGCGTVFRLAPPVSSGAAWTYSVILTFRNAITGFSPGRHLLAGTDGTLYGTTLYGGSP